MFKLKIADEAKIKLKQISKEKQITFGEIFEEIRDNPLIGKPLTKELTKRFSYKIGSYRIIYLINIKDKVVTITSAGHRGTIYKV